MHPVLRSIYNSTVEHFRQDERILAAWEFGSIGKGTADEFSDVDPVFVVEDAYFDEVDRELRPLLERFGYRIALWWPEGFNAPGLKNYAVLLDAEELLQYDMMIVSVSAVQSGFAHQILTSGANQILFDKTGLLQSLLDAHESVAYTPEKLVLQIERYWVYVYIHVKYLRRGDLFKLLYGQQTLFQNHLDILRSLHPDASWDWWPWTVKNVLSAQKQDELLVYFGAAQTATRLRRLCDRRWTSSPQTLARPVGSGISPILNPWK
jgi:hypothetical protein